MIFNRIFEYEEPKPEEPGDNTLTLVKGDITLKADAESYMEMYDAAFRFAMMGYSIFYNNKEYFFCGLELIEKTEENVLDYLDSLASSQI